MRVSQSLPTLRHAGRSRPTSTTSISIALLSCAVLLFAGKAAAHEHQMNAIPQGEVVSAEPIDSILWTHIIVQISAWAVLYPLGMVLGIVRSRWHVPVQTLASALAILGYILGHSHKGRQFTPDHVHAKFSNWLMFFVAGQVGLGVYLRMHLERGLFGKSRRVFVIAHGVLGKAIPVAAWVQMLFGAIVMQGFCTGDHLGQCLAHFIMGSAFVGYGIVLTILMLVGQNWLRRRGRSQEFFDSAIIAAWGCVNTFTEHRWGGPWVGNDLQHTTMGIIWWSAGLVGMWLSRDAQGRPKRNIIPGIVILLTGWAMSAHPQHLMLSTMVHSVFGYTLMAAGLTRIIEISFVLRDRNNLSQLRAETEHGSANSSDYGVSPSTGSSTEEETSSFQYLPVFLLYASGFLFMGATEEMMEMLSAKGVTHVSYILILYSIAFMLFLFVNVLLRVYSNGSSPASKKSQHVRLSSQDDDEDDEQSIGLQQRGTSHQQRDEAAQIRRAEEFELAGLISDEDDEEAGVQGPKRVVRKRASDEDSGSGRRKEGRGF